MDLPQDDINWINDYFNRKPIRKKFDQAIYDVSDSAKFVVGDKLVQMGFTIEIIEDYQADIKSFKKDLGINLHEVEHRTIWDAIRFPFSTIHIPERKTRLLQTEYPLFYWVVNKDKSAAMVCNATNNMTGDRLIEVSNNQIESGEFFYDIPILKFKYIKL